MALHQDDLWNSFKVLVVDFILSAHKTYKNVNHTKFGKLLPIYHRGVKSLNTERSHMM